MPPRAWSACPSGRGAGAACRRGLFASRADVAHYMLWALSQPDTFRQTIGIAS